jgi:hypothetical protein
MTKSLVDDDKAKVLLVGAGIVARAVARQLDHFSIEYDWIAAVSIDSAAANFASSAETSHKKPVSFSYSPKLNRSDYICDQTMAASMLGKIRLKNFLLSRSVRYGGLVNYWGANTAQSHTLALLGQEAHPDDIRLISELIPTISFEDNPFLGPAKKKQFQNMCTRLVKACLSMRINGTVYSSELALNRLPAVGEDLFGFNPVVVGNVADTVVPANLISGVIRNIEKTNDLYRVCVQHHISELLQMRSYCTLVLCGGPLENLRMIASLDSSICNQAYTLQHHPILTGFLWCLAGAPPTVNWPLSCIDLYLRDLVPDSLVNECYVNMIPAFSAMKLAFGGNRLLVALMSLPPVRSVLSRLFVVNVYLPSSLSASYVNVLPNEGGASLEVFGNYHPSIYSLIPAIKKRLSRLYVRSRFFPFLLRLLPPGTDQHISSTLSEFCNDKGFFGERFSSSSAAGRSPAILIPDASSAKSMPISNPTYSFVLRAVGLIRSAVKDGSFV